MPSLALILAAISLTIWIVLTFFRGAYWQVRRFDGDAAMGSAPQTWPRVVAVVPARNEAETIAQAVASLAAQDYPGEFRIFIVDDHSEDQTGTLAQKAAAEASGGGNRVTVEASSALQQGWTGKLWALQQGVAKATASASPDYFWFTDADIVHAPDTLRRLVMRAENKRRDLVSLMVLLQAKTLPERLLIPPFLYFFLMLYPPKWIEQQNARTAGAAGGCILLKKAALERIGGLSTIREEVIDDCSLARVVKHSGGAIWMGLTRKSVSLRVYHTFAEIRDLIARTAFTQLRYSVVLLVLTILGMALTYFVPIILTFHPEAAAWRIALAMWALMTLTYLPTVRFYSLSPLWSPLLPFAAFFYFYATALSAWRYWLGRGGQWKGRAQAPAA